MKETPHIFVWILLFYGFNFGNAQLMDVKELIMEEIFMNYNSETTPPSLNSSMVMLDMELRDVEDINPDDQECTITFTLRAKWKDSRLQYDDQNGKIDFLTFTDLKKIWRPDLYFQNSRKTFYPGNHYVRIYPNGDVLMSQIVNVKGIQSISDYRMKIFPFEFEFCQFVIASYAHPTSELKLFWKKDESIQSVIEYKYPKEFLLNDHYKTEDTTEEVAGFVHSSLAYNLVLRRIFPWFYLTHGFIPSAIAVMVCYFQFWIPSKSSMRIFLSMFSILFILAHKMMLKDHWPTNKSVSRSVMDDWFDGSLIMTLIPLIHSIFIFILQNSENDEGINENICKHQLRKACNPISRLYLRFSDPIFRVIFPIIGISMISYYSCMRYYYP